VLLPQAEMSRCGASVVALGALSSCAGAAMPVEGVAALPAPWQAAGGCDGGLVFPAEGRCLMRTQAQPGASNLFRCGMPTWAQVMNAVLSHLHR
jgi:hypothetical protein